MDCPLLTHFAIMSTPGLNVEDVRLGQLLALGFGVSLVVLSHLVFLLISHSEQIQVAVENVLLLGE